MALLERGPYLQELHRHLQDAAAGRARIVFVGGEAGIGKTTLVRAFAAFVDGGRSLHGACDPLATPRPMGPFLDMLPSLGESLSELVWSGAPRERVDLVIAIGDDQQGVHYRNVDLISDPGLDPMAPELIMYEPRADGSLRLIGGEWIVFQQAWHDAGNAPSPALYGREFSLNTTLLDEPFYALHLWVWQFNPLGLFANWNPLVQCGEGMASTH